jgi:hypothetical protein
MNIYAAIKSPGPSVALGFALLLAPQPSHAFFYSAEAIEGWVVDAESGKPLEGVIVVAHWQLQGGFEGGTPVNELNILEATTDQNGRYSFPAWGPKFALMGKLRSESPEILMYKQGYKFQRLLSDWHPNMDTSKSDWNRKTIKLERFSGTLALYAESLTSLSRFLWTAGVRVGEHSGSSCGWKSFPRMLRALDRLEAEFRTARVARGTIVSDLKMNSALLASKGCGKVSEVLEGTE